MTRYYLNRKPVMKRKINEGIYNNITDDMRSDIDHEQRLYDDNDPQWVILKANGGNIDTWKVIEKNDHFDYKSDFELLIEGLEHLKKYVNNEVLLQIVTKKDRLFEIGLNYGDITYMEEYTGEITESNKNKHSKFTKINESSLTYIVKESIKKVLNEVYGADFEDTLRWVQKKNPDMSPEEQERFAKNIIKKREHDKYLFNLHITTSSGGDIFKRELTWNEAKKYCMKYDVDDIYYKNKDEGPYGEWHEFNPSAFFNEDE